MEASAAAQSTNIAIIIAVIGFASGFVGALIAGLFQRKKINSESDSTTATANEQIRKTVMELMKPLRDRVDELERELQDWKNWALALVRQIKELGCEPVPFKSHKEEEG